MAGEILGGYRRDGDAGFHAVAGLLHVGVPAGLGIVEDHVEPAPRGRRDHRFPVRLEEPLAAVQRFIAVSAVAGNDQDFAAHPQPA